MKSLTILLSLLLISPASARDFRPPSHLENIPASNSSIQQCYVFQTTPGVAYTVEVSSNLSDWTPQDEIYGLGGEYAVAMREFTPPPPQPPGTPPANPPTLASNVSLRLQPASGAAGGSVVAWRSLDHDGPIIVRIAAEIDPGWYQIPIFWDRFDDYYFYFWHPGVAVAPPAANSALGPKDSAMLAVLEASVPAINQQIAASILQSRNAPPPAPPDPDSKRFWRVKVDWSLDTDQDGSPDWAEFEIAARGTGMLVPGVIADAFNADTNNDGIPDGEQLDADLDGTPDFTDPDSTDNSSVVPFGPIPRYALFEIPGNALQINDLGTVIFPTKVWKAGVLNDLPGGGTGEPPASARAINDLDVILGTVGTRPDLPDHPSFVIGDICYWPSPTSTYETIHVEDDGETVNAYRLHDGIYQQGPAPVLTNSGHFIAQGNVVDPPLEYWDEFDYHPTLWQIPIGTAVANRQGSPAGAVYLSSPSLKWGTLYPRPANGHQGIVYAPAALPSIPFVPLNVISQPLPKGGAAIFATPPLNLFGSANSLTTQVYVDGKWRENELYANAIDIAGDGTAIGKNLGARVAPILLNDQWSEIDRTAPGAPAAWLDPFIKLIDTTPHGWVLARDALNSNSAAMLPIRVEGKPENATTAPKATGVDEFSIGSPAPGAAVRNRIWIMAPLTEGQTEFTLKAPLNSETPLKLKGPDLRFDGATEKILTDKENSVKIESRSSNVASRDVFLELSLGGTLSGSQPLGVKIMKDRIVRVRPFLVTKRSVVPDPANPVQNLIVTNPPDLVPLSATLQTYLNAVFRPQLNTTFVVETPVPLQLEWDDNGNGSMDPTDLVTVGPEQQGMLDLAAPYEGDADIKVFFLGTDKKIYLDTAWGLTNRDAKSCWIVGDTSPSRNRTLVEVMHTTAHEIGHLLVGYGHPDDKRKNVTKGPAPLPDTNHKERLMHSGEGTSVAYGATVITAYRSHRLVKGEWDEAELWLNTNIKDPTE